MALDKYKIEALITESKNLDSADGDFSISYLGRKIDYKNTMNYTLESSSMEDSYVYKTNWGGTTDKYAVFVASYLSQLVLPQPL